jgi:hypothetical protein
MDLPNITCGFESVVGLIEFAQMFFPLRSKYTLAAHASERQVEATQTGKEVNKSECSHFRRASLLVLK